MCIKQDTDFVLLIYTWQCETTGDQDICHCPFAKDKERQEIVCALHTVLNMDRGFFGVESSCTLKVFRVPGMTYCINIDMHVF